VKLSDDPRVVRGMHAQLELRRQRLSGGDAPLGWKVGFGVPAMLRQLNISGPLVGFLTRSAGIPSGAKVSLSGWAKPVAEPEIAVHIARDIGPDADRANTTAAIGGISPAIELVDVTTPPEDPEEILRGNIYQRHVVLRAGPPAQIDSAANGLVCRVIRRGAEVARTTDPQANTGNWIDLVRHVANLLAGFGEVLRAGEIVITGSVVPPIGIEPREDGIAFEVDPIGGIGVRFRWA
jgi:2-keto-4-pentenoate hydratase